jgi:large subunit ribosomal protein L25
MSSDVTLTVQRRERSGKEQNKKVRARGSLPAVVYGGGLDPLAIEVEDRALGRLIRTAGVHAIFKLQLAGSDQSRHAMIRDLQYEPTTGRMLHVDFQRVIMDQVIRVAVPIETSGVPLGVKNDGGLLDFVTREVEVECLPGNIPDHLVLDVSELHIGQHVEASALSLPEGVTLLESGDRVIVSVSAPRLVTAAETEEGALLEKAAVEPEVIGRGKAIAE